MTERILMAAPLLPPTAGIAQFLGLRNWLIAKVRASSPDRARDAINLVAATVDAPARIGEYGILGEDLVDGRASTRGVVFPEDVVKVARQQGRYAMGHGLSPLEIACGLRQDEFVRWSWAQTERLLLNHLIRAEQTRRKLGAVLGGLN